MLAIILAIPLTAYLVFQSHSVQRWLIEKVTDRAASHYKINVDLKGVDLSLSKKLIFEGILVTDDYNDTIIYIDKLSARVDSFKIRQNQLHLSNLELSKPYLQLIQDDEGMRISHLAKDSSVVNNGNEIDFICKQLKMTQGLVCYKNITNGAEFSSYISENIFVDLTGLWLKGGANFGGNLNKLSFKGEDDFNVKGMSGNFIYHDSILTSDKVVFESLKSAFGLQDIKLNLKKYLHTKRIETIALDAEILPTLLSISDLSYLFDDVAELDMTVGLAGNIAGSIDHIRGRDIRIDVNDLARFRGDFSLDGLPDIEHTFIFVDLKDAFADLAQIRSLKLPGEVSEQLAKLPVWLENIGEISYDGNFTGFINDFVAYGKFTSDVGNVDSDISFKPEDDGTLVVNGNISSQFLDLAVITQDNNFGELNISSHVSGSIDTDNQFDLNIDGTVQSIEYNDYLYTNINLDGEAENKRFIGKLSIDDPNVFMDFGGIVDMEAEKPIFEFDAKFRNVNLYELNFVNDSLNLLGFNVKSNFRAQNIDEWLGAVTLDSISLRNSNDSLMLNKIEVVSDYFGNDKLLTIKSDILDCTVKGQYQFSNLGKSASNFINYYLPSIGIVPYGDFYDSNQFSLDVAVKNLEPVTRLFMPEYEVKTPFIIDADYAPRSSRFDFRTNISYIKKQNQGLENITIRSESEDDELLFRVRADKLRLAEEVNLYNLTLDSRSFNDKMALNLFWNNSGEKTYSGNVKTVTTFSDNPDSEAPHVNVHFDNSTIYIADTLWRIKQTDITIDSSNIAFNNFNISNKAQKVNINGALSELNNDELSIKLEDVNMVILDPFMPPKAKVGGILNGQVLVKDIYQTPKIDMVADVTPFKFKGSSVGELEMNSSWNNDTEKIVVTLKLEKEDKKLLTTTGTIDPQNGYVDLWANLDHTPVSLMDVLMPPAINEFEGEASGKLHFSGSGKHIMLDGHVLPEGEVALSLVPLNARIWFDDEVRFNQDSILFPDIGFRDEEFNDGKFWGSIKHTNFKDMVYDLNMETDRILIMNTNIIQSPQFYGIGYVSGEAKVTGEGLNVILDANIQTEKGSDIVIPLDTEAKAKEYSFIQFVDRNYDAVEEVEYKVETSGMQINLDVKVTPEARAQIFFTSQLGDVITATGSGNLQVKVDRNFKVDIYGNYVIEDGDYSFTLQNVVNKKFSIEKGSELKWTGAPYDADIDLRAIYNLKASLYNLFLDSYSINDTDFSRRMPVQVIIELSENLMHPKISFDIELPTADDRITDELEQFITTEEDMTRQVTFLLLAGQFYTPEYMRQTQVVSTGAEMVGTTASELLSNYLSSWLSKISDDFDIGINYRPGNDVTTEQLELALSTQMFDDRVMFSGNIGNTTAQAGDQTYNIVGDFDLIVKLNESGKLQAKVYNRSNDPLIYDMAPYTQGIGIKYREDFNGISDLWYRLKEAIFRKKKVKPENKK